MEQFSSSDHVTLHWFSLQSQARNNRTNLRGGHCQVTPASTPGSLHPSNMSVSSTENVTRQQCGSAASLLPCEPASGIEGMVAHVNPSQSIDPSQLRMSSSQILAHTHLQQPAVSSVQSDQVLHSSPDVLTRHRAESASAIHTVAAGVTDGNQSSLNDASYIDAPKQLHQQHCIMLDQGLKKVMEDIPNPLDSHPDSISRAWQSPVNGITNAHSILGEMVTSLPSSYETDTKELHARSSPSSTPSQTLSTVNLCTQSPQLISACVTQAASTIYHTVMNQAHRSQLNQPKTPQPGATSGSSSPSLMKRHSSVPCASGNSPSSVPPSRNSDSVSPGLAHQMQHAYMTNFTVASPGSASLASPGTSRPPSRQQGTQSFNAVPPPPPPIWPPSVSMSTNQVASNILMSPNRMKQQTSPPVNPVAQIQPNSSSISPVSLRSPLGAPTSGFLPPHLHANHTGALSSFVSPSQSPAPSPSTQNPGMLISQRSGYSSTSSSALPSPHPSPVSQHPCTTPMAPTQTSTSFEGQLSHAIILQTNTYANTSVTTIGQPHNSMHVLSAPGTPVPGSSPGMLVGTSQSHVTHTGSGPFVIGGSSSNSYVVCPPKPELLNSGTALVLSSADSGNHRQGLPVVTTSLIMDEMHTNAQSSFPPHSASQTQPIYSNTEMERQRLKEILAKQVHQRQLQQQQQQQQQQQLLQEHEHGVIRHAQVIPPTMQHGQQLVSMPHPVNDQPNTIYVQQQQTNEPTYVTYPGQTTWQYHTSPVPPRHQPKQVYYAQHQQQQPISQSQPSHLLFQQLAGRPASLSPVVSRPSTTPVTQSPQAISPALQQTLTSTHYFTPTASPVSQEFITSGGLMQATSKPTPLSHCTAEMGQLNAYAAEQKGQFCSQNLVPGLTSLTHAVSEHSYATMSLQRVESGFSGSASVPSEMCSSGTMVATGLGPLSPRGSSGHGLEEVGYEPPVIVSRVVAAKEKRYPPASTLMNVAHSSGHLGSTMPSRPPSQQHQQPQSHHHFHHHPSHQQQQYQSLSGLSPVDMGLPSTACVPDMSTGTAQFFHAFEPDEMNVRTVHPHMLSVHHSERSVNVQPSLLSGMSEFCSVSPSAHARTVAGIQPPITCLIKQPFVSPNDPAPTDQRSSHV
ncbi:hypothetical protein PHET_04517 [Paragonimus heterotremus]|uniref:Uncharacterized protein n=1 Tax=Paragonimus heterotremus TaxID=100268 RepID=A0A8J4SYY6_9TREM|nr:hypothetical protein PHET_04517 [Paragonimus heterotremus]